MIHYTRSPYYTCTMGFFKVFYPFLSHYFNRFAIFPLKIVFLTALLLAILSELTPKALANEVRDTELENMVRAYTFPILKVADIKPKDVRLYIIADKSINAAVFGQKRMLIHTGLLLNADEPEDVLAIIAHEIAHMKGNHVAQKQGDILANSKNRGVSTAIGAFAGIASGDSGALIGGLMLSEHLAQSRYLQYSRSKEQVADIEALKYLERAGISPRGVINILGKIQGEYGDDVNPYFMSHPMPAERIRLAQDAMEISPYAYKNFGADYTTMLYRAQAKITAYTVPFEETLIFYPLNSTTPYATYAHAIAHMQTGRFEEAHAKVDILLQTNPQDPFYRELKGEIFAKQRDPKQAIDWYNKALEIIPWASLIHYEISTILLAKAQESTLSTAQKKLLAQTAIDHLIPARRIDPEHPESARGMAQAYNILGDRGRSALALAEYNLMIGDFYLAKRNAELADQIFTEYTPDKIKAQDLLAELETIMGNTE